MLGIPPQCQTVEWGLYSVRSHVRDDKGQEVSFSFAEKKEKEGSSTLRPESGISFLVDI